MRRKVVFAKQSTEQGDHALNTGERLVNVYPEIVSPDARSGIVLRPVLGEASADFISLASVDDTQRSYAVTQGRGSVLVACDQSSTTKLIRYNFETGSQIFSVNLTGSGSVSMLQHTGVYTVGIRGTGYFAVNLATGTQSSISGTAAITNVGTVTYLSGYVVLSEDAGNRFEWLELNDPTTRNALNVATAESHEDFATRVIASQGRLYVFGPNTTEIWALTGLANANAFERVSGGVISIGLLARYLAAEIEDTLYFISTDAKLYRASGFDFQAISDNYLARILEAYQPRQLLAYTHSGHTFICIRFDDRPAVIWDTTTGLTHERSSGAGMDAAGDPWNVVAISEQRVSGDLNLNPLFFSFDGTTFEAHVGEDNAGQSRVMISTPLEIDGQRFRVPELEIRTQPDASASFDISIRTSKDGGTTWSSGRTRTIAPGSDGKARFRALGAFQHFTLELTVEDGLQAPIEGEVVLRIE